MRHKLRLAAAAGSLTLVATLAAFPAASAATLLADDFGDGNSTGWSTNGGTWTVTAGAFQQAGTSTDAKALAGSGWTDQAVQARVRPIAFNGANRHAAVLARAQSTSNYYYLAMTNSGAVVLGKRVGGGFTSLASAPASVPIGSWATLRLEAFGTTLRGFLDNVQVNTRVWTSAADNRA